MLAAWLGHTACLAKVLIVLGMMMMVLYSEPPGHRVPVYSWTGYPCTRVP